MTDLTGGNVCEMSHELLSASLDIVQIVLLAGFTESLNMDLRLLQVDSIQQNLSPDKQSLE